jgi:hypothetical protein
MKQYLNTGSLQSFLLAILFGIAATALALAATPSIVFILVIAVIVLILRHQADWLPYVLGGVVGVLLYMLLGIALPEQALLVVIFGSVWF